MIMKKMKKINIKIMNKMKEKIMKEKIMKENDNDNDNDNE